MYYVKELSIPNHQELGTVRCLKCYDRPFYFVEDLLRVFGITEAQVALSIVRAGMRYFALKPGMQVTSSADAPIRAVPQIVLPDFSEASRKAHPGTEREVELYFDTIIFAPEWVPRDDAWCGYELEALDAPPAAQPTQSRRLLDWLHPDLRSRINEMLADDRFSYKSISAYLRRYGVRVSPSTVGRYARNTRSQYERCH